MSELPFRKDRDDFIRKSLETNPDFESVQVLRERILSEGWVEYPGKSPAFLSTAAVKTSLQRLGIRRHGRNLKNLNKPFAVLNGVAWQFCPRCGLSLKH